MNQVCLYGRTTKDVELQTTTNGKKYCRFTLAVKRRFKDANGENVVDFHNVVCWSSTAEICSKYAKKGRELLVRGELQNRSYEGQDGTKKYVTEIIADEVELVGTRPQQSEGQDYGEPTPPAKPQASNKKEMEEVGTEDDFSLPF